MVDINIITDTTFIFKPLIPVNRHTRRCGKIELYMSEIIDKVKHLYDKEKKNFREIGELLGFSKSRAHALYHGGVNYYRNQPDYHAVKRHEKHVRLINRGSIPKYLKSCIFCNIDK